MLQRSPDKFRRGGGSKWICLNGRQALDKYQAALAAIRDLKRCRKQFSSPTGQDRGGPSEQLAALQAEMAR